MLVIPNTIYLGLNSQLLARFLLGLEPLLGLVDGLKQHVAISSDADFMVLWSSHEGFLHLLEKLVNLNLFFYISFFNLVLEEDLVSFAEENA